jgi:hypothetical protein
MAIALTPCLDPCRPAPSGGSLDDNSGMLLLTVAICTALITIALSRPGRAGWRHQHRQPGVQDAATAFAVDVAHGANSEANHGTDSEADDRTKAGSNNGANSESDDRTSADAGAHPVDLAYRAVSPVDTSRLWRVRHGIWCTVPLVPSTAICTGRVGVGFSACGLSVCPP